MVDRPPPDPSVLLQEWMTWERGEAEPGQLIKNLKKAGMRELLEQVAATSADAANAPASSD
ncbi:MAG: hypothetical protein QOF21_1442 [Actinomycetota bacterium]|jgi:hypothetical protein